MSFVNNPPGHPVCVIKFNGLSLQYVVPHIKHISYIIYLTVAQKPCMHAFHLKERWTSSYAYEIVRRYDRMREVKQSVCLSSVVLLSSARKSEKTARS